jgi:hypothetical protein
MKINTEVINDLYDVAHCYLEEYALTMDGKDLIDLHHYEPFKALREMPGDTKIELDEIYKRGKEIIENDPNISDYPSIISTRLGATPVNGMLQLHTKRGYVTEINSMLFSRPIDDNYISGIYRPMDWLKDSRSGTKALASQKQQLEQSEYQGRRLRILGLNVKGIKKGDCGSREYIPWHVVDKKVLQNLEGVWYKDGSGESVILPGDEHLIGKWVEIRNPQNCLHTEHVCERCFGLLHLSHADDTNIGWACAAIWAEIISQGTLSLNSRRLLSSAFFELSVYDIYFDGFNRFFLYFKICFIFCYFVGFMHNQHRVFHEVLSRGLRCHSISEGF